MELLLVALLLFGSIQFVPFDSVHGLYHFNIHFRPIVGMDDLIRSSMRLLILRLGFCLRWTLVTGAVAAVWKWVLIWAPSKDILIFIQMNNLFLEMNFSITPDCCSGVTSSSVLTKEIIVNIFAVESDDCSVAQEPISILFSMDLVSSMSIPMDTVILCSLRSLSSAVNRNLIPPP